MHSRHVTSALGWRRQLRGSLLVVVGLLGGCEPSPLAPEDGGDALDARPPGEDAGPDIDAQPGADAAPGRDAAAPTAPEGPIRGAVASHLPLEIIQPQPGLDERNRFYKAYPGLLFDVQIAVVGGTYPYRYALTEGPAGMNVDPTSGVLRWTAPLEEDVVHPVTVEVVDQAGARTSVAWTIRVTAEGWLFIDASAAASGGDGSLEDPYVVRSIAEMYRGDFPDVRSLCAKDDRRWEGYFVYFMEGTYLMDGYSQTVGDRSSCAVIGERTAAVQYTNRKPTVWLAYPGAHPTIDMSEAYMHWDSGFATFYFEGFDVDPITNGGSFALRGNGDHITIRNNRFHDLPSSPGSNNQSAIMLPSMGSGSGRFATIVGNELSEIHHGYGIIGYTADRTLFADNHLHDIHASADGAAHAIGPKVDCTNWFIRGNRLERIGSDGVWLYWGGGDGYGPMEVSYNAIRGLDGSLPLHVNQRQVETNNPLYVFRNTFVGGRLQYTAITSAWPDLPFHHNVVINEDAGVICTECEAPERIVESDDLVFGVDRAEALRDDFTLDAALPGYDGTQGHVLVAE